jgi:hypothetical protein
MLHPTDFRRTLLSDEYHKVAYPRLFSLVHSVSKLQAGLAFLRPEPLIVPERS